MSVLYLIHHSTSVGSGVRSKSAVSVTGRSSRLRTGVTGAGPNCMAAPKSSRLATGRPWRARAVRQQAPSQKIVWRTSTRAVSLGLADVFSGEIDFNSDLQPGDHFKVLVERHSREGKLAGYGPILAAEFVNDGRQMRAIRFTPEGGPAAYYDDQGRSLKRFFLKSPLKFEPRVTSRFSASRQHPVLGYARAHNGVDYHAGTGAPVVSVAPGVVTFAGWTNGGGRTVKVRHPNGYETEYLHLSAITVKQGLRIGQGELVGKVGQTGLTTGPHLHYGLKKNGSYVNPVLEHRNMPPGDPVAASLMNVFSSERDRYLSLLFTPSAVRAANNN